MLGGGVRTPRSVQISFVVYDPRPAGIPGDPNYITLSNPEYDASVRPSLYLDPDLFIDSGNGSAGTPFVLAEASSNADLSALTTSAGGFNEPFAAGTTAYTMNVANSVTSMTITPTVADATATVTVNGTTVTSGSSSSSIGLTVGTNPITVVVTAQDSSTKTYTIRVDRAASSNADLSALTTSAGGFNEPFAAGTTAYTMNVANSVTSMTVTPTVADATATVTVNGSLVTSGSSSSSIALTVGANPITVMVTAQDSSTKTYTISVERAASSNADLSALTTSAGGLNEPFAASTSAYTMNVANSVTSMTITPTVADATATVTVNGKTVTSGVPSSSIALTVGANPITVMVTAQDSSTKTYTISVDRAASSNGDLSALTTSAGGFNEEFAASTSAYTMNVANSVTSMTITPTVADATATVTVNGTTVTSGSSSSSIALTVGVNPITVVVTAQDSTTKTYTIRVERAASSNADLSALTTSAGGFNEPFAASTTAYTMNVANSVTSMTITPTVADATATVTVNGTTVTSGSSSSSIALTVGANSITVVVTAQDSSIKRYTISVDRAAASSYEPVQSVPVSVTDAKCVSLDPASIDTSKPSFTLEVAPKDGTACMSAPASTLTELAGKNATFFIEIKTPYGSYQIPVNLASLIPGLTEILAKNNLKAEDISFRITLSDKSGDKDIQAAFANSLPEGNVLGAIVDFDIDIINTSRGNRLQRLMSSARR